MQQVVKGSVVSITYRLAIPNGEAIHQGDPLEVFVGGGRQVPLGIQEALIGRAVGDTVELDLEPEQGYGAHDPTLVLSIPRERFPEHAALEPGMLSSSVDAEGNTVSSFAILEVRESTVLCDYNHPLAGVTTRWRVRVESVRAATELERAQGYAAA